jgi:hypothetical protein
MSTIGLYSNLYSRLAECAELLDRTSIQLKQQQEPTVVSEQQKELGELLASLGKSPKRLDAQLLAVLLQEDPRTSLSKWAKLGEALLSNQITDKEINELENLAKVIEYERASTFSRMRGGNAR